MKLGNNNIGIVFATGHRIIGNGRFSSQIIPAPAPKKPPAKIILSNNPGALLALTASLRAFSLKLGNSSLKVSRISSIEAKVPFCDRIFSNRLITILRYTLPAIPSAAAHLSTSARKMSKARSVRPIKLTYSLLVTLQVVSLDNC